MAQNLLRRFVFVQVLVGQLAKKLREAGSFNIQAPDSSPLISHLEVENSFVRLCTRENYGSGISMSFDQKRIQIYCEWQLQVVAKKLY